METGDWKVKSMPSFQSTAVDKHRLINKIAERETVEFSVKGPVPICIEEEPLTLPGCSILDIIFSTPSAVGELVFRNYYTAWLSVLVKTEQTSNLTLSVARKNLMPSPHEETGSHGLISIVATESSVPWKNLLMMRLVLRQPSPIWRVFHVEEINVYTDLPRLTVKSSLNANNSGPPTSEQYDKLLGLVRRQTLASLNWTPAEPKGTCSPKMATRDIQKSSCGYEITKLPQV